MEEIEDLLGSKDDDFINNPKSPKGNAEYSSEDTTKQDAYDNLRQSTSIQNNVQWEGVKGIGDTGYGDSQWDSAATYKDVEEGRLNDVRATMQPWQDQLANAVTQMAVGEIIGGSIEAAGYLLDWQGISNIISGDEKEYTNWLSDIGKGIREETQEATQIYEKTPGEMNLSDPGYWFKNSVSVASTLSMMLPSMAAGKALRLAGRGASKFAAKQISKNAKRFGKEIGEEAADISKKMGLQASWVTDGMTQATVSRHIENSMEASGTFEEKYNERMMQINPKTGEYYTDEEAKIDAANAAAENYKHGWAMLAQDMVQYLGVGKVFNPFTKQMEVANKMAKGATKAGTRIKKAAGITGTFASEAGEEGYQNYISTRASLRTDLRAGLITQEEYDKSMSEVLTSDESKTSMLFGGLGGSVFQMVGPAANKAFKSKNRKEMEDNAAEAFQSTLDQRAKAYAALNVEKAKAERAEDVEARDEAMDNIAANMALDGVENDKQEEVYEAMMNAPEMTKEEHKAFEEKNGYKYDQELAKDGAEKGLKTVEEVKDIYYKNKKKSKYKNTPSNVLKSITLAEYQNKKYKKKISETQSKKNDVIEEISYDPSNPPSKTFKDLAATNTRISALRALNEAYQEDYKNNPNKESKARRAASIKENQREIKSLEKKAEEIFNSEEHKNRTADQKNADENANKVYDNIADEIFTLEAREKEYSNAMQENHSKIKLLNSKAHQKKLIAAQYDFLIASSNDIDQLNRVAKSINNKEVQGFTNEKERKDVTGRIEKKIKAIKDAEKAAEQKRAEANTENEHKDITKEKNDNPNIPDNNVTVPVEDSIEDANHNEEIDFTDEFQDEQEEHFKESVSSGKAIALLDGYDKNGEKKKDVVSGAYRNWMHDGLNKIGTKITYRVDSKLGNYGPKRAQLAVKQFNEAKNNGTKIPEHVYRHYPIKVFVGEGTKIWSHLPEYNGNSEKETRYYEENYAAERKTIIDSLYNDIVPTSEVKATSGGVLVTQVDQDGVVAQNNVKDLKQVQENGGKPHIVFSDKEGKLMEMDKKSRPKGYRAKRLKAGKNEDGSPKAYRGGVFLLLKKADGYQFPVRLNFANNTQEQSSVLANLLIDVAVPEQKGSNKKYNFQTRLSQLDPTLIATVTEAMPAEVAFFKDDPTLKDIFDMFVYISDQTEGMTSELYMSGEHLYFNGGKITPENRNNNEEYNKLVNFLATKKKRQFNIKMWNDTENFPGYRDFVFDNKILSTDVITGEPEFQKGTYVNKEGKEVTSRVQAYIAPIATRVATEPKKGTVISPDNNLSGDINDDTEIKEPSKISINKAIEAKIPKKGYKFGVEEKVIDGNTVMVKVFGGDVVPPADAKIIREIIQKEYDKFNAENAPVKKIKTTEQTPQTNNSTFDKDEEIEEAKAQRDFEIDRLNEIDTSDEANIISAEEVESKKRDVYDRYAAKVNSINKTKEQAPESSDTEIRKELDNNVPSHNSNSDNQLTMDFVTVKSEIDQMIPDNAKIQEDTDVKDDLGTIEKKDCPGGLGDLDIF